MHNGAYITEDTILKHFLKVFITSLISFLLVIGVGVYVYSQVMNPDADISADLFGSVRKAMTGTGSDNKEQDDDLLKGRINVLLLGMENSHTDTIMLASFDTDTKDLDVISIPRDTYIERDGFVNSSNNKINTVYTVKGIDGLKSVIENMLQMPVDNYVAIDYDGVRAAVDALGGVEVDVPFHMKYYDPYCDPPLKIDIPAGSQVIYGDTAMEFLRFRKTNYEGYSGYRNGDIGRIETQQAFVKSAVKKALSIKLPSVISQVYPYVKTDVSMMDATKMAVSAIGMSADNIQFHTLPGEGGMANQISFYFINEEEARHTVRVMYGMESDEQDGGDVSTEASIQP